jgi:glycosyltransferase involved in cell wall biosynthesis
MSSLYRAADAFVLPSRGEAYGRPFLEAMAMGLPTIGPRMGGNMDFMTDENSYLVDCKLVDVPEAAIREVPDFVGHRWAEPDVNDLRKAMRRVFEEREEGKAKGAVAREHVLANYRWEAVARSVMARLEASGTKPLTERFAHTTALTWEGPYQIAFGLAEVNRELGRALADDTNLEVKRTESADLHPWMTGRPPDVTVRHQWPLDLEPPRSGRWVTYQPWEFGSLPAAWIEPMNRRMDEVWVPTRYVRDCYVRSGVDGEKVKVVPYGIDPSRFHPGARPADLPTAKKHRFLFVGGTIARKGADILLETYTATFNAGDDVCLVVRDLGARTFYRGQGLGAAIDRLRSNPAHPEIVYLEDDLPADDMAGLYTACQCLVHPYRGEGFGLPIAEAMACGLAVIVPRHGACLDYCDDKVAYLVKAREVRLPQPRVGNIATVERPWWAEVDRAALARAMRRVVDKPGEARAKGRRASARIRSEFTWERAAQAAAIRIAALAQTRARE